MLAQRRDDLGGLQQVVVRGPGVLRQLAAEVGGADAGGVEADRAVRAVDQGEGGARSDDEDQGAIITSTSEKPLSPLILGRVRRITFV